MVPARIKQNRNFRTAVLFEQHGGSLVELALILPFLTVILFGVVEIGNTLTQLSWVNNTACQTANFGATASKLYGEDSMAALWDQLYQIQDNRMDQNTGTGFTANYDSATDSVQVTVSPKVNPIFGKYDSGFSTTCNGSYLIKTVDSLQSFEGFSNRSTGEWYDCSGAPSSTPNTAACNWSPPPPPSGYGGDPGCNCFAGDTSITMADGSQKPISAISVGDLVLAWDETSNKQTSGKVTKNFERVAQGFFILNGSIRVTEEHPFFVVGKWVNTKDLKIGDKLSSMTGAEVEIKSIEKSTEALEIFNVTVDSAHTYYAAGVLVHNKNCSGNGNTNPSGSGSSG